MRDPFYTKDDPDLMQTDLSKFTEEQLKAFTEINKEHCKMNERILGNTEKIEFKIPKIDASQLKIFKKSDVYPDTRFGQLESPVEDIMSHIRKALIEADNNYIKSNMIIIDQDLAITNHLFVPHYNYDGKIINYSNCNPMMFGRAVKYQKNLTKDLAANFVITQGPDTDRVKELEEENARLREQLNQIKELLNI